MKPFRHLLRQKCVSLQTAAQQCFQHLLPINVKRWVPKPIAGLDLEPEPSNAECMDLLGTSRLLALGSGSFQTFQVKLAKAAFSEFKRVLPSPVNDGYK